MEVFNKLDYENKQEDLEYIKDNFDSVLWWEVDNWDYEAVKIIYVSKENGAIENEAMSLDDLLEYEKE